MPRQYISDEVNAVIELYCKITPTSSVLDLLSQKAECIFQGHRIRKIGAYVEITNGFPPLLGKSVDEVFKYDFTRLNAHEAVSKIHGFNSWNECEQKKVVLNLDFEKAVDLLLSGNLDGLEKQLADLPHLISEKSAFPHGASLLHYCANNGVETERQVIPHNLPEIAKMLIAYGADKSLIMEVYKGQYTAYQLASTSAHIKAAGIEEELLKILN